MNKSFFGASEARFENACLHQKIKDLTNENKDLKKNIEVILEERGYSKNKKKRDLQVENEMLYFKSLELDSQSNVLQDENSTLSKDIQCQKEVIQDMEGRMKELENEKAALILRVEDLQKDDQSFRLGDAKCTCEPQRDFQEKRAEMEQQIQALQNSLRQANTTLRKCEKKYCMMTEEKKSLNNQNQVLKQELQAKKSALEEQAQELRKVLQKLTCLEHDNNIMRQCKNALEQEVQELTKKMSDCLKQMSQNDEAFKEKFQTFQKGSECNSEMLNEENESLCQQQEALKADLICYDNLCSINKTHGKEIECFEQINKGLHCMLTDMDTEKITLYQIIENLEKDNEAFRLENDALSILKMDFQREKDQMRAQIQALQNDLYQANTILKDFRIIEKRHYEVKAEVKFVRSENQILTQELQAMTNALGEQTQELKNVLRKFKCFEHDNNRKRKHRNTLEPEVRELTKKMKDCQTQMSQNHEAFKEKVQQLQTIEKEVKDSTAPKCLNNATTQETQEQEDQEREKEDILTAGLSLTESPQEQAFKIRDVADAFKQEGLRTRFRGAVYNYVSQCVRWFSN